MVRRVRVKPEYRPISLTRGEAIALVNICTLAVKHLPELDMPEDFGRDLESAVNGVLKTWNLKLCSCCDLVKEGGA